MAKPNLPNKEIALSADEIRRLADKMMHNALWFDESNEMERMEQCFRAKDALLAFAAMVERCEKIRYDILARTFRHDIGWMGGGDKLLYTTIGEILQNAKGATDEGK